MLLCARPFGVAAKKHSMKNTACCKKLIDQNNSGGHGRRNRDNYEELRSQNKVNTIKKTVSR